MITATLIILFIIPPAIVPVLIYNKLSEFRAEVVNNIIITIIFKIDINIGVNIILVIKITSSQ